LFASLSSQCASDGAMMADAALAGGRTSPLSEWRTRLFGGLADRLAAEGERRLLWLPVFFGAGIGIYFLLKVEPPLWPGIAAAIAGLGSVIAVRRHRVWFEAALAFTVFAAGFALMRETAWEREVPMLQRHLGPIAVTGRARLPARALFRRHRRGRVHLWRRASGGRTGERRRMARESAAASYGNDAADRRRPSRLDRRRGFGADYR